MSVAQKRIERTRVDNPGSLAAVIMKQIERERRLGANGARLAEIRRLQALAQRARELDTLGAEIFSGVAISAAADAQT